MTRATCDRPGAGAPGRPTRVLVVGDRDAQAGTVSVRLRTEEQLGALPVGDFLALVGPVVATKSLDLTQPRAAQGAAAD